MNGDGFRKLLLSYNDAQVEEYRQATRQLAINLYIYFDALCVAGFNKTQALQLTKSFQETTLLSAMMNKGKTDEQ